MWEIGTGCVGWRCSLVPVLRYSCRVHICGTLTTNQNSLARQDLKGDNALGKIQLLQNEWNMSNSLSET